MHRAMRRQRPQRRPPLGRQIGRDPHRQTDVTHAGRAVAGHLVTSRHGQVIAAVPVTGQVPACAEGYAGGQGGREQLRWGGSVVRTP